MAAGLPKVRIGEPRRQGALAAFPLFTRTRRSASCRLAAAALGRDDEPASAGPWDVMSLLNTMFHTRWRRARTIGDGEEYRGTIDGEPASLLCCDGIVVHDSIVPA